MSFASLIPHHPETCNGVTHPIYDPTQCRLCWLATFDAGYRRLWKIDPDAVVRPKRSLEEKWPCIHRGSDKIQVPGCSTCNGRPAAYPCNHPLRPHGRCLVAGTQSQMQNARSQGFLVCLDCGMRTPEPDLEAPLVDVAVALESPPEPLAALSLQRSSLSSPDSAPADPHAWKTWKVTRLAIRERLEFFRDHRPVPSRHAFAGRGIVIGCGGPKYFRNAFAVVAALRHHGCTLPVEFWHLGPQEIDANLARYCQTLGIKCVDATTVPLQKKPRLLAGWELKPFSVLHSKFAQVLYLDADCVPLRDPTFLFDSPQFSETGAIFWPDLPPRRPEPYSRVWIRPEVWDVLGMPMQWEDDFESGQFIIDKERAYDALVVTQWMNDHSDFFYSMVYGDKSTYHLAWRFMDRPYSMPPACEWSAPCIMQKDFEGKTLFAHATGGKHPLAYGERFLPIPSSDPLHDVLSSAIHRLEKDLRFLHLTTENGFTTILGDPTTFKTRNPDVQERHVRRAGRSQPPPA